MAEVRAPGRSNPGGITPSQLGRGSRLGRYELLAPIGVGGMAKVWAARQSGYSGFAKVVAIKTILPHLSRESDFERLFVDEARVASLVHHPNVCEIFELGEDGQVLFLVMEWVDGDSLIKLLKTGNQLVSIDFRIAARIAAETCAGLHAAHTQVDHDGSPLNIVHRDVSPHNILLSAEGVVKVTDFGVAKAAGQTHDQTVAGQLKGKLEYMSPEQITGGRVDGRTDVFGMGGVIYEATTGVQPFASGGDLEVMNKIVEGRLRPPSEHFRRYPKELEAIVMCAMSRDPGQRFASADEMRGALEAYIARSGPPVTHAEVAALLRSRVGSKMDERLERIRRAMTSNAVAHPSHTPSGAGLSTSGVIATGAKAPRIAPVPPPTPHQRAPHFVGQLPPPRPPPRPPAAKTEGMVELNGPDSGGFNMDTVADFQLPDFLDPGGGSIRPPPPDVRVDARPGAPLVPTPLGTPAMVSPPSPAQEEPPSDVRQYILAVALGIGVAVVVGGLAYAAWRATQPSAPKPHGKVNVELRQEPGATPGVDDVTESPARGRGISFPMARASPPLVADDRSDVDALTGDVG